MTGKPSASIAASSASASARQLTRRPLQPQLVEQGGEPLAVLAGLDRLGGEAGDRDIGIGQVAGQVDRGLPAERQQHQRRLPGQRPLVVEDVEHALGVERLEVQPRAGVVVGAHRLGVVVDHHRVVAQVADGPRGADRAVVELDPLTDADRPRPDHDHRAAVRRWRHLAIGVRGVEVRRLGRELAGTGVHPTIGGGQPGPDPGTPDGGRRHAGDRGDLRVAEPVPLRLVQRHAHQLPLGLHHLRDALGEPRRDAGHGRDLRRICPAMAQQADHPPQPGVGRGEEHAQVRRRAFREPPGGVRPQPAAAAGLERAHGLEQGRPELAVDGHRLPGGLHLHAEIPIGERELVERPARQLDDDVVDRRLEGGRSPAGGRVAHLVQPLAERDQGRDAGDRVAGGLRRQGGRAGDARVDLDHPVVGSVGRDRQLDVAAALQLQRSGDGQRRAAQALDDDVGQGLDGRDHDRVPGVDAHGVEVLHPADGDRGVGRVADDLELDLLPAEQAALDEDLADGARLEPTPRSPRGPRQASTRSRRHRRRG